jgi:hypothetical protein
VIMFVSGATATTVKYPGVGELIVPGAGSAPDSLRLAPGMWAMDNGAFAGFDAAAFMRMLQRFYGRRGCRFVSAPDVVSDGFETMKRWPFWSAVIRGAGFVPALVLQDGMLVSEVPWPELGAVFVGGSTEWKMGPQARDLMAYAKARGLWVHVGRVNSEERTWAIFNRGADSFDGTGFSMFPDINIPKGLAWVDGAKASAAEQGSLL